MGVGGGDLGQMKRRRKFVPTTMWWMVCLCDAKLKGLPII